MSNFPRAFEKHYLVSSVMDVSGKHTADLKPFQLGLFDSKFYKSVGSSIPQSVLFAVGSAHTGQKQVKGKFGNFANVNSVNRSYKSPVIDTRCCDVVSAEYVKAQTKNQQQVGYLGYDGVNYCGSMQFECDKTYFLEVEVVGQPVRAMWGRDLCETVLVTTDCCDSCVGNCDSSDMKEKYLDELLRKINKENGMLDRFIKASKVIKHCTPQAAPTKTNFTKYCVTLCDNGDAMSLARVQAAFDFGVSRVKREDGLSTYESDFMLTSAGAPANYVAAKTVLQDCAVCPAGATAVPATKIYKVTIDNDGVGVDAAAWLAEVQAKYPTALSAERLSFDGTSVYLATFPLAFVEPTTPVADAILESVGMTEASCVMPSATYTWSACGTCYKVVRTLRTTIQNPDCNPGQVLLDLQKAYGSNDNIVPGSVIIPATPVSDNCKTVYELQQYSNCMQDGCDWTAEAEFTPVQAWNGFTWEVDVCEGWTLGANGCPIPPVVVDEDFVAGIRFDVIYEEELPEGCGYSIYDSLNKEPIYVRAYFGEYNNSTKKCKRFDVPYKVTQNYKKENLRGHSVIKNLIMTGFTEGEVYYDHTVVENAYKLIDAEGLNYGIDKNKFYDYVSITFNQTEHESIHHAAPRRWTSYFYFEQNDVATKAKVLSLVNKILAKSDISLLA